MSRSFVKFLAPAAAAMLVFLAVWGCKEKFVPHVIDADEIQRFIEKSPTGSELFMWDSLILPIPYHLPFTTATFVDSVIAHDRTYVIAVPDTLDSLPSPLNFVRHARVKVQDRFTVKTLRVSASKTDTVVSTADRNLTRLGWFYKLGSDYEPYSGWYLWYFQGQDSSFNMRHSTTMQYPNLAPFSVDPLAGIKISEMRQIPDGSTLIVSTHSTNTSSSKQPTPVMTLFEVDGPDQRQLIRIDRYNYRDTIKTRIINPRIWNLIYMQTFHDDELFYTGGFVIPYRVPQ